MPPLEKIVGWNERTERFHKVKFEPTSLSSYAAKCTRSMVMIYFGHPKDSDRMPCKHCWGVYAREEYIEEH